MSTIGKVFVVLNLLLAGIFLGYASTSLGTKAESKRTLEAERAAHEETRTTLTAERDEATGRVAELSRTKQASDARVSDLEGQLTRAELDRDAARQENNALNASVDQLSADISTINTTLESIEQAKDAAVAARVAAEDERDQANDERDAAIAARRDAQDATRAREQTIAGLEADLNSAQENLDQREVELAALVEYTGTPLSAVRSQVAVEAAVLAVKYEGAGNGLVSLNVGSADEVAPGYVFDIHTGTQYKGRVKVLTVYENICSAEIIAPEPGTTMVQGDSASSVL